MHTFITKAYRQNSQVHKCSMWYPVLNWLSVSIGLHKTYYYTVQVTLYNVYRGVRKTYSCVQCVITHQRYKVICRFDIVLNEARTSDFII